MLRSFVVTSVQSFLPPHIVRSQPHAKRRAAAILELNEDRTIEPEPCSSAVEPHFTVPLEHDTGTHRDRRTVLVRAAGAGSVADLLPVTPGGCAVVLRLGQN